MKRIACHSGGNTRITNEIIILNLLLSEIDFYKTALKNPKTYFIQVLRISYF